MGMGSGGSKGGGYAQPQQTQSQMGGMGGKGKGGAQQQYQPPQQLQGGMGGKGGQQQNPYAQSYYQPQFRPQTFNNPYSQGGFGQQMGDMEQPQVQQPQVQQPQGGMGGKGGPIQQYLQQRQQQQGGMGGKGGQERWEGRGLRGNEAPPHVMRRLMEQEGTEGPRPDFNRFRDMMRGQPSGLAALAQPTATTQAATPAPEQPYMGNYLS